VPRIATSRNEARGFREDLYYRLNLTIERNEWNMTRSAAQLGLSRATLYRKLRQQRISVGHGNRGSTISSNRSYKALTVLMSALRIRAE
jgi:DNA-binding NtrC family response regulator